MTRGVVSAGQGAKDRESEKEKDGEGSWCSAGLPLIVIVIVIVVARISGRDEHTMRLLVGIFLARPRSKVRLSSQDLLCLGSTDPVFVDT